MAKILDNGNSLNSQKLMATRKKLEWVTALLNNLENKYQQKKENQIAKFVKKANRQLKTCAFLACDKTVYACQVMDEKLQNYDVKAYMQHRKQNTATAKALFVALASGQSCQQILDSHDQALQSLRNKRDGYVQKLKTQKQDFLAKHNKQDDTAYLQQKKLLDDKFDAFCNQLDNKYQEQMQKERQTLQAKADKYSQQIALLQEKMPKLTLPEDVLLEVRNLKMYFGGLKAVDDLSFTVKKGEIFGLIGPNGAGKTTVFICITRFYDATDGQIYFDNKYGEVVDMHNYKVHDVILQGIARTFQNIELVKEVSVIENLLVASTRNYHTSILGQALAVSTLKTEEDLLRKKAMEILRFMGIESYANWLAFGLPYGILKKVEIARALMADAKLIIMDEPAAGLNDTETAELTKIIRRIRDTFGATILLVEHDMGLVMNVCDTVCAISFGKMLAIGTTEEIKSNKAVQEAYLGTDEEV